MTLVGSFWPWLRLPPVAEVEPPPSVFGLAALEVALRELGKGEFAANNQGEHLDRYRTDLRGQPGVEGAWCAAFVSYCIEQGASNILKRPPVARSHGAKKLFDRCLKAGHRVSRPCPGDIACWHRGAKGARTGHIGIVSRGLVDGEWECIEGNRGSFPSKVRRYTHELGEPLFLGWARLP